MRLEGLEPTILGSELMETKVLILEWRRGYNQARLRSALGYRPPAPEVIMPVALT